MVKKSIFVLTVAIASNSALASTSWLKCANAEATLVRRQTNYPNGGSASVWTYKLITLNPVEQKSPRSGVEVFEETSRKMITSSDSFVVGTDGVKRKKTISEFSVQVTVSAADSSSLDPVNADLKSITENVICKLSTLE